MKWRSLRPVWSSNQSFCQRSIFIISSGIIIPSHFLIIARSHMCFTPSNVLAAGVRRPFDGSHDPGLCAASELSNGSRSPGVFPPPPTAINPTECTDLSRTSGAPQETASREEASPEVQERSVIVHANGTLSNIGQTTTDIIFSLTSQPFSTEEEICLESLDQFPRPSHLSTRQSDFPSKKKSLCFVFSCFRIFQGRRRQRARPWAAATLVPVSCHSGPTSQHRTRRRTTATGPWESSPSISTPLSFLQRLDDV